MEEPIKVSFIQMLWCLLDTEDLDTLPFYEMVVQVLEMLYRQGTLNVEDFEEIYKEYWEEFNNDTERN